MDGSATENSLMTGFSLAHVSTKDNEGSVADISGTGHCIEHAPRGTLCYEGAMTDKDKTDTTKPEGERIAKVMARAGLCSRRDAERWIADGRVRLNGKRLTTPAITVTAQDKVEVDGKPLPQAEQTRMWRYHKPVGLVTSARDEKGRATIFDKMPPELPRVLSIGRLDINTEGLLLLTNDGGVARTLELPSTGWLRRYRVRAYGRIEQAQLDALKKGVQVDGVRYGPVEASLERTQGSNVWIKLGLREGKNREVKKILEHLGLTVNRLIRVSYGPFQLGEMQVGEVVEVPARTVREQLGVRLSSEDKSKPAPARKSHAHRRRKA